MEVKEEKEIRKNYQDIINHLSVILRTAQIHDTDNIAVVTAIERFLSLINSLLRYENIISLDLIGEFFYINDNRVRYSLEHLLNFDYLTRELKKRRIGSIIFKNIISKKDIQLFIKAFLAAGISDSPYEIMSDGLEESDNIEIGILKKIKEGEEVDRRKIIKKVYFNAVSYSKGVITKIKAGEKVNIKKAKRIVETMVDQILEEEKLLLGMTAIKDYDEYTYHHSVNVSILSVALGQRLGLSKKILT